MLDARAARHAARDVAPDEEGYEQRQEYTDEPGYPAARGTAPDTHNRKYRADYGSNYAAQDKAGTQGSKPPQDDADPARSSIGSSVRFTHGASQRSSFSGYVFACTSIRLRPHVYGYALGAMQAQALIQPIAWKGNSQKSGCRILHSPAPIPLESPAPGTPYSPGPL